MLNFPLPRIESDEELRSLLLPYCRLEYGEIWEDKNPGHKVGCLDSADNNLLQELMKEKKAGLAIQDPPYNFIAFEEREVESFIEWSKKWIENSDNFLDNNSSLYIWLGADQNHHFRPLADFILMMSKTNFNSRSFITMRNQRGYGTQRNWMSVRQELLYYIKGKPIFNVYAEYTDIPKILNGYYKKVNGNITNNFSRSKSNTIRAGNVWVDIQQVFYRMDENINGCYAQKPLKSIERIINASSEEGSIIIDFFAHSGTTLLAAEITNRICYTVDIDPIFCEITIRRLENFRRTKRAGWQNSNPFAEEILEDKKLQKYLRNNYQINVPEKELKNI